MAGMRRDPSWCVSRCCEQHRLTGSNFSTREPIAVCRCDHLGFPGKAAGSRLPRPPARRAAHRLDPSPIIHLGLGDDNVNQSTSHERPSALCAPLPPGDVTLLPAKVPSWARHESPNHPRTRGVECRSTVVVHGFRCAVGGSRRRYETPDDLRKGSSPRGALLRRVEHSVVAESPSPA